MIDIGGEIERELKEAGMSRKELAQRTNVSEKHISTVISGEHGISPSFARKLGYVFKDTSYWLRLQADYESEQAKLKEENSISSDEISILKNMREITTYFIERDFMHNDCGDALKVMQLREFLNISNLTLIPKVTYNAAYRAQLSTNVKVDPYVLFAWQRMCEKETENIILKDTLNVDFLNDKLLDIKAMMFNDINDGISKLQEIFSQCGIAFQVVKNFRGAPVQGFIKKTAAHRLILCLTIRRQRADIFWFTLFHEIAHIINHDYSNRFIDFDSIQNEVEIRADKFSSDFLIPPELYREFLHSENFSLWESIENFARKIEVQPFIVLGRLQKDGLLDWSDYPEKILKYSWA